MVICMTNRSKEKGDRGEREAVAALRELFPGLVLKNSQRKLGAGRKEDTGDLVVFHDVTIQVKNYADVSTSLREAAVGAAIQGERAGTRFAFGMAPIPRARRGSVRWLAATLEWPGGAPDETEIARFGQVSRAVARVRQENIGIRRDKRVVAVDRRDSLRLYVAPVEAWVAAWQVASIGYVQPSLFDDTFLAGPPEGRNNSSVLPLHLAS